MFVKRFLEWIRVKQKLDLKEHIPPSVREGDLWWCAVGDNVGVEISGKGTEFTRPVIVLKKFGRHAFFGIPTSTKVRTGDWYVSFTHKNIEEQAMLTQGRLFSYKRLTRQMGSLTRGDFKKVKEAHKRLFYQ